MLAWRAYSRGKVSDNEISAALYSRENQASNGLVRWATAINPAALTYLKLAWQAEEAAPRPVNAWEADSVRQDTSGSVLPTLLGEARAGFESTQDPFLKERYAFQAVKLAAMAKNYALSRTLYDDLVRPLSKKTFLSGLVVVSSCGGNDGVG